MARRGPAAMPSDHRTMHEAVWSVSEALAVLEDPDRSSREDPLRLWRWVGLRAGMTVVDVGAGTGYYARPAAGIVGPAGRVLAVDLSPDLLRLVRQRARAAGLSQLRALRSRPGRIPLRGGIADRVLLANVLHGLPARTVAEAVRLLRPGGQLVDVDWKRSPAADHPEGPPFEHRLSVRRAQAVLAEYGLRPRSARSFGPSHYVVVMERPRRPRRR